ncbi:DUF4198 domain-containing protein [uncultured Azonexus sp.]|uniref:DUF4198 domain-containing protein n=1 Tax=uncultured Azonexus sp. TaxID=520307 RepID=UPI00260CD54B|nr:DUF4198 domain-containing protein [uncultured Azonexus sp.]
MKNSTIRLALAGICSMLPAISLAHNVWLLPSSTVLSKAETITVDAAVSNDLFVFNYLPLALENLSVRAPDGSSVTIDNPHRGKLRSVFDLKLQQTGTYQLTITNRGAFATYRLNGENKRWRGAPEALATAIPKEATDLVVTENFGRVETFVSLGNPGAVPARNSGLELLAVSHPNDLVQGQSASFQLIADGKPAPDIEVNIIRGGTRHRNRLDNISMKTGADGKFTVTWPEAGMYWLEAELTDKNTSIPQATQRRLSYAATLEVTPE